MGKAELQSRAQNRANNTYHAPQITINTNVIFKNTYHSPCLGTLIPPLSSSLAWCPHSGCPLWMARASAKSKEDGYAVDSVRGYDK